jgi:hypothetical protein
MSFAEGCAGWPGAEPQTWRRAVDKDRTVCVGLDTPKAKIAVAVAEPGRAGEVRFHGEIANQPDAAMRQPFCSSASIRLLLMVHCARGSAAMPITLSAMVHQAGVPAAGVRRRHPERLSVRQSDGRGGRLRHHPAEDLPRRRRPAAVAVPSPDTARTHSAHGQHRPGLAQQTEPAVAARWSPAPLRATLASQGT